MPSHSGSNFTFHNSLEKIKSFLINSSALWECVADTKSGTAEYSAAAYNAGSVTLAGEAARTIYFKCTGYDGLSECYFALYNLNSSTSYYNVVVRGLTFYVEGRALTYTGYASNPVYLPCTNLDSTYHITGDERKVTILALIGTRPYMMGFGMFLQSGTPTEYPKPMFVGGGLSDYTKLASNSVSTDGDKCFFSPGSDASYKSTLQVLSPLNVWEEFDNYGNDNTMSSITVSTYQTLPYTFNASISDHVDARAWGSTDVPIFPISIYVRRASPDRNDYYGEFDGVFYVSGKADVPLVAGDTLTISGVQYIVWSHPNISDGNAFCAVRMEN